MVTTAALRVMVLLLCASMVQAKPLALSLAQALSLADSGAHDVHVSSAAIDEAVAYRKQTRASYLPTITLAEEVARGDDPVAAFGTRLRQQRFTAADFDLGNLNEPDPITNARTLIEVHQPLFSSGRNLHDRRSAQAEEKAARAAHRRTRDSVRLQTATAYWGMALAQEAVLVLDAAIEAARQHAAEADAGWRAGTVSRGDRLATNLRVAELAAQRIDADTDVLRARDQLTLWLGLPAATDVVLLDHLELEHNPSTSPASVAPPQRADVEALAWRSRAAEHRLQAARGAARPQVGAFARFAADSRDVAGVDGTSWMAGAVVHWQVFSGFAARGAVDAARARALRTAAEAEQLSARAQRDLLLAQRDLQAAHRRVEVAAAAMRHADEQVRVVRAETAAGIGSVSSRLDAETAWRGARLRRLQALHDVRLGMARLAFAGGALLVSPHND